MPGASWVEEQGRVCGKGLVEGIQGCSGLVALGCRFGDTWVVLQIRVPC